MRILILLLITFTPLAGCVKRTISISSNPSGALVWVNDKEVGRTPLDIGFLYYGEYDVRVEKNGFEPIMTTRWAKTPAWDAPFVDIVSGIVSEVFLKDLESNISWGFDLETRNDDPALLLDRATSFRSTTIEVEIE